MELDVRQILWDSAAAIADHLAWAATSSFDVPVDLEVKFNGGASPAVARHYGQVLDVRSLPDDAQILDLGCGFGRVAMELTRQLRPGQRYIGLDPSVEGIEWAQRHIGSRHPNFTFERIDVRSQPYNPDGTQSGNDFRFPFDNGSLDLVFMISVLTHVDLPTVETYLREAARTLKPATGRLVSTIFLLDDEVDELIAAGRSRFSLPWSRGQSQVENPDNPELVIAHPRQAVLDILANAGFEQVEVVNGHWSGRQAPPMDFQDLLVADRATGAEYRHPVSGSSPPETRSAVVEERIREQGFCSRDELLGFITWSVSVTLNALWWQDQGWSLVLDGPGRPRLELTFEQVRSLGIPDPRTGEDLCGGGFHPVDDAGIVGLLLQAAGDPGREDVLACIHEAARNGFVVRDAMQDGGVLLLVGERGSRPAPIPAIGPS